ncbi:MAG TPA: hypothetical protein VHX44_10235 [Planctomycetota bacterium]|nr:hypothetical protein [Planctomycetota bacterium]
MSRYHFLALVPALLLSTTCTAFAVDEHHDGIPRLVAEVVVGTAGFEPGVAAEWRFGDPHFLVRPEVFINDDGDLGGGASIGWELTCFHLPDRHTITVGPRVVYHNSDDYGWGADAMAIWHFDLVPAQRGRHFLEVIGTVGAIEEEKPGDNDIDPAVSVGVGYGYQF